MQTLYLRFRALRTISLGQGPSRWQTRSMQRASKWETASLLPNPLRSTCAVGWRPTMRPPVGIPCPVGGAGPPDHRLARASDSQRLASDGLSFPLRPQRCGARASGNKTVGYLCNGSGTIMCSGASGFCPTGRRNSAFRIDRDAPDFSSTFAHTHSSVTRQMGWKRHSDPAGLFVCRGAA